MRAWTDGERHGIETEAHDAELASAVSGALSSVADLAHAVKGPNDTKADGIQGTCFRCNERKPLRPLIVQQKDSDTPDKVGACEECQAAFVEERYQMLTDEGGNA